MSDDLRGRVERLEREHADLHATLAELIDETRKLRDAYTAWNRVWGGVARVGGSRR